jgi:hypothetical protein
VRKDARKLLGMPHAQAHAHTRARARTLSAQFEWRDEPDPISHSADAVEAMAWFARFLVAGPPHSRIAPAAPTAYNEHLANVRRTSRDDCDTHRATRNSQQTAIACDA